MEFDSDVSLPRDKPRMKHREAPRTKGTCDRCALSKVKCDRRLPHCARCVAIGEDLGIAPPCHYTVSLRSLKRKNGRGRTRARSSTESTQLSAPPPTPELHFVDWATTCLSEVCESDVELETLLKPGIRQSGYPFGSLSLPGISPSFQEQPDPTIAKQGTLVSEYTGCTDLIHSCVREMVYASKQFSLQRLHALVAQAATTFDTVTACPCAKASSSAFQVAYLFTSAFRMFRSAVESHANAASCGHSSRLVSLRGKLERISTLADTFNAAYCEDGDVGPCQLLKYYLSMDLKHCLDDLDRQAEEEEVV